MSKKGQKVLASASVMSLVLSTVAMAAPVAGTAVSGTSRVDTSVAIAKQAYSKWTDSKVAVIANGADAHLVDALTVAPLAYQKEAPIFLTLGTSTLEDSIINELKAQGVTTVYVVGGTVTTAVDAQLKAAGVQTVTHLAGATRFETAQAINTELEKGGAPSAYAVVNTNNSVADALSIASEAAKNNIEIVLASDANSVPVDLTGKTVYAVGGTGVLSDALVTKLNATRLAGANRFATNAAVLGQFGSSLDYTTTYVADGTDSHLVDSLPGSVLAAQTGSPIVLVSDSVDPSVASVLTGETSKMTTVTPLGGAVNANAVAGVVDPTSVGTGSTTPVGPLAVSSVAAASASSITVKFNQPVSDTTKVSFNVTRSNTPVTLTTSWDSTNTVATLTSATVLPQDTYAVDVKNDTTDLGSSNVSITQQKIDKIAINSTTLAVAQPVGSAPGLGYATYQVFDQYGNDITDSALAASITWTCGIGSASASKGLITVQSYNNMYLTQYTTASMNGIDQSTGVTASANLTVSQSQGTLSSITLDALTNVNNVPLTAEDTTDTWYINYTAKDLSGNTTTNYDLIKAGLLNGSLTTSNPYVTAQLIRDPNNNTNALIQVTVSSDITVADEPLVITAFTTSGQSGTINLTLKKAATLDTFTLMAPDTSIAYGDTNINIPFTAYDQNGNQLTKYSDIASHVTLSGGFGSQNETPHFVDNPDGTCSVQVDAPADTGSTLSQNYTMQATTDTGKYSSLNVSVQQGATADTLSLDNTVAIPDFEPGAVQDVDFGANFGGLTLKDQYGRVMNMSTETIGAAGTYVVAATTSGSTITLNSSQTINIGTTANPKTAYVAYNNADIQLIAGANPGTTTINYEVYKIQSDGTYKDTGVGISQQYTVVKPTDITGYTIGTIAPLYDVANTAATTASASAYSVPNMTLSGGSPVKTGIGTANIGDYENSAKVYGTLSGGAKVALAIKDILGATVDDTSDFIVDPIQPAGEPAQVAVYAKATLGTSTKPTATGSVSVTLLGQDGLVHTATGGTVNSKDDAPIAKSVAYSVTQTVNGANTAHVYPNGSSNDVSTNGNVITMSVNSFTTNVVNQILTKYSPDGNTASGSWVYFYGVDQYGTDDAPVSSIYATTTSKYYTLSVDPTTNKLIVTPTTAGTTAGITTPQKDDVITLTATFNGLIESVNISLD